MSGALWRTFGAVLRQCATSKSAYLRRFLLLVAQVAHHINKYIENSKKDVVKGTKGFSCATCATSYTLIPISKPKRGVAQCATSAPLGAPLERSAS